VAPRQELPALDAISAAIWSLAGLADPGTASTSAGTSAGRDSWCGLE
jgi:hypothetical protein